VGEAVGCSLDQVTERFGDGHHIVAGAGEPSDLAANDEPARVARLPGCAKPVRLRGWRRRARQALRRNSRSTLESSALGGSARDWHVVPAAL